jgi:hypothetical protein
VRWRFDRVEFQESECDGDRRSLVPVNERLRLRDVKGVCR